MSLLEHLMYRPAIGRALLGPVVLRGYARYLVDDRTPTRAYRAMRKLYGNEDAALWDALVERSLAEGPLLDLPDDPPGVAQGQVAQAVAALDADGCVVLDGRLDVDRCDRLEAVGRQATCTLVEPIEGVSATAAAFDPDRPLAVRYEVPEADLVHAEVVQDLLADESLLAVAQAYLGAAPVQDLVAMWWSAATGRPPSSAAAQQYHFDLDRIRFLKLFVYLSDVDDDHGPHVYVRGSHRDAPAPLRRDGRHADAEVEEVHPGAATVIDGPRGTMFLADTRGMHKGTAVRSGHRLVFQLEWASSLFGGEVARPRLSSMTDALASAVARHPRTYRRFTGRVDGSGGDEGEQGR
jgi:hypothetical protein